MNEDFVLRGLCSYERGETVYKHTTWRAGLSVAEERRGVGAQRRRNGNGLGKAFRRW